MSCNLTASDWVHLTIEKAIVYTQANDSCWPWSTMNVIQWLNATTKVRQSQQINKYSHAASLIITPIGFVGSICCILSVWHKSIVKRESFYIWMLWIGILDFLFNLFSIPVSLSLNKIFKNLFRFSYFGTELMSIFYGCVYGFSLAADLCTLGLTIERYLSVCKPATYLESKKNFVRILGGSTIFLLSSTRFIRFGFEKSTMDGPPEDESTRPTYNLDGGDFNKTEFFGFLVAFTDMILPFLLLLPMIYFSAQIAFTIVKRNRSRSVRNHSFTASIASINEIQKQKNKQTKTMLNLLAILVVLFFCNEIGYCLSAISYILKRSEKKITFRSTFDEVVGYAEAKNFNSITMFINAILEYLLRALNFYLYFGLSGSVRNEFMRIMRCEN